MSDMEDDFMCDDEEDYDLVFTTEATKFAFKFQQFLSVPCRQYGLANISCLAS